MNRCNGARLRRRDGRKDTMTRTANGRDRVRAVTLLVGVFMAVGPLLLAVRPALAGGAFTVTSVADASDANVENARCDVDATAAGDQCTLRAAIQQANNTP